MDTLKTERLLIVPLSLGLVRAAIAKDEAAFGTLGYHARGLWPYGELCDALPFFEELLLESGDLGVFGPWIIVKRTDHSIIGDIGFKGPPDEIGAIEIGFSVIPTEHRRGYCREAAEALLSRASCESSVENIIAECLVTNVASQALLAQLNFKETGRDETMIKWVMGSTELI